MEKQTKNADKKWHHMEQGQKLSRSEIPLNFSREFTSIFTLLHPIADSLADSHIVCTALTGDVTYGIELIESDIVSGHLVTDTIHLAYIDCMLAYAPWQ